MAAIALAAAGAGFGGSIVNADDMLRMQASPGAQPSPKAANRVAVTGGTQQAIRNGDGGRSHSSWGYPRPGWSVRQGQRMARKKANRAKNRRAHR